MNQEFTSLSYEQKRKYVLDSLSRFSGHGETFTNLHTRISLDPYYPEEKLIFIAEKFTYYKKATASEKQQEAQGNLQRILADEQPTSEEELEKILSAL